MELKKHTYIGLLELANDFADKDDIKSVLVIKDEIVRRIEAKLEEDKSPAWGSLMGYYQICTILESMEKD